jgi:quercetin dioxygenase-like cupin family protein
MTLSFVDRRRGVVAPYNDVSTGSLLCRTTSAKEAAMRKTLVGVVTLAAIGGLAAAQEGQPSGHVLLTPPQLKWGEPPPILEKGATFIVISGDPGKPGPFVVRLKMPAGYKIAPHWHPTDEHVTVLSGTFSLGMGEKFDKAALKDLPVGGYGLMPAEMRHFAQAKTAATVQVHGQGPFALTYVNPADDPSQRAAGRP